jgi:hypothetical protein
MVIFQQLKIKQLILNIIILDIVLIDFSYKLLIVNLILI